MTNKLSQWFIDYVKKKNKVDLSKNDPQDNWQAMNPFKYSIRLGGHVMTVSYTHLTLPTIYSV